MDFTISREEQRILLADARESIVSKLERREPAYCARTGEHPVLREPCGAFVTLTTGGAGGDSGGKGNLRGCIGSMRASRPLEETVRDMAREAAFSDPRFPPLRPEELPRCRIEISALSPMTVCPNPRQVQVGIHGLFLIHDGHTGVLLPQVPVEQNWNQNEYLAHICIKAGLPPGSYNAPGAVLYTFTAIVFGEPAIC